MANQNKKLSVKDGKKFMRQAFELEQNVLGSKLELSSKSVTHDATMGEVNENHFIDLLRRYLPKRYSVNTGIIIDSKGVTSDQIDVIIYDNSFTPVLLDQHDHRYIPVEAVYVVIEVKSKIDKFNLEYSSNKAKSVRALLRTHTSITSISGEKIEPKRERSKILSGIVASNVTWKEGFNSRAFKNIFYKLNDEQQIDFGLGVNGEYFDLYDTKIVYKTGKTCTSFFLFRLLHQLQQFGNVLPIDWNKYANLLS